MNYVDGFVVPVRKDRVEDYRAVSQKCSAVWKDHGALDYVECVADDVQPGKLTSFPQAVQLEDDEVVVFSWITYPSREVRDACNAKVMEDPRLQAVEDDMKEIMGMQRMFWGGFKPIVQE
ncbi:DUF1428 domain-containing protein [Lysobacter oculi]|uniref:DUF1428 domain-containing protein n=1 Tax=Solilutibacter oculi TaxID=2698682 RepID=A0A344J783_9GAMM|nr:DUF1428 domain-containing protein [Lysobacter oculi]AXA84893.1 DUF1428 domain-containing protein [Lysobacter oculi]